MRVVSDQDVRGHLREDEATETALIMDLSLASHEGHLLAVGVGSVWLGELIDSAWGSFFLKDVALLDVVVVKLLSSTVCMEGIVIDSLVRGGGSVS